MIKKAIYCLSLLVLSVSYGQMPSEKIDIGVFSKNINDTALSRVLFSRHPNNHKYKYDFAQNSLVQSSNPSVPLKNKDKSPGKGFTFHISRSIYGDTTSVSQYNEYIEHLRSEKNELPLAIFYTDLVTNKEWRGFQQYVTDSTIRRLLARENPAHYLNSSRSISNLETDPLNWNMSIKGDLKRLEPIINHISYNQAERYYGHRSIDVRKLAYKYPSTGVSSKNREQIVSLFRDSTLWITDSSLSNFGNLEDGMVQFYNTDRFFENYPVTCVNSPQARAYLEWKQKFHQLELDKNGIELKVRYSLPNAAIIEAELAATIMTDEFDLQKWQITNKDYSEFVTHVRDSIARTILAQEYYDVYLKPIYDDDMEETDPSRWPLNHDAPINWDEKTGILPDTHNDKAKPGLLNSLFTTDKETGAEIINGKKLFFRHYFMDFKTASIDGIRERAANTKNENLRNDQTALMIIFKESAIVHRGRCDGHFGKDLNLSFIDNEHRSTDIHAHQDRSQYIVPEDINVYPGIVLRSSIYCLKGTNCYGNAKSNEAECLVFDCDACGSRRKFISDSTTNYDFETYPDDVITSITYAQFRAYWWWKLRKNEFALDHINPVIKNYLPSKEEFEKIQNGNKLSHPKQRFSTPTPSFRCKVEYFSK